MIDQDVYEYVKTMPKTGVNANDLKRAIEILTGSANLPTQSYPDAWRTIIQAARNWLLIERLPELLQLPGEPALERIQLNVSFNGKFSVDGWIDEDSPIEIVEQKATPSEVLREAFAKT